MRILLLILLLLCGCATEMKFVVDEERSGNYKILSIYAQKEGVLVNAEKVDTKSRITVLIRGSTSFTTNQASNIPEIGEVWEVQYKVYEGGGKFYTFIKKMDNK